MKFVDDHDDDDYYYYYDHHHQHHCQTGNQCNSFRCDLKTFLFHSVYGHQHTD